jgi:hypothetical protein
MTASTTLPSQVDALDNVYDTTWVDAAGNRHYRRARALGEAAGPATWSDAYHDNLLCGHHLSAKCRGCNRCLDCGHTCLCS